MAHDYKLAPVLDDSTNYIDWYKELDVWVGLTEPPEKDLKVRKVNIAKIKRRQLMMLMGNLKDLSIQMKCL